MEEEDWKNRPVSGVLLLDIRCLQHLRTTGDGWLGEVLPATKLLDELGVTYFAAEALQRITELFTVFYFYN